MLLKENAVARWDLDGTRYVNFRKAEKTKKSVLVA
jgi:hypothetical protein